MARDRSKEEILDQMVWAVACVARHYGPGLSASGLRGLRQELASSGPYWCDGEWRSDVLEGGKDGNPDFCPAILKPDFAGLNFDETVKRSKTGEED